MFEKPFFQKLNKIADWLIRIVVINVIVILLCLTVVLFFVGIKVGYALFTDYLNSKETPIFAGAWKVLKDNFSKSVGYSAFSVIVIAVTGLNIYFYLGRLSHEVTTFIVIGFFITFAFLIGFFIVSLYMAPVLLMNPNLKFKETYKLSLYLAGKNFLRSFIVLLGFVLMPVLLLNVYTSIVYVLAGMSFSIIIFSALTKNIIVTLKTEGNDQHIDEEKKEIDV